MSIEKAAYLFKYLKIYVLFLKEFVVIRVRKAMKFKKKYKFAFILCFTKETD